MEQTHLAAVLMGGLSFQGACAQTVVPGKIPPASTHMPSSVLVPVGVILGKVPAICGFFNSGLPALRVCSGAAHQKLYVWGWHGASFWRIACPWK